MDDIERQRVAAVNLLRELGYRWVEPGVWLPMGAMGPIPAHVVAASDLEGAERSKGFHVDGGFQIVVERRYLFGDDRPASQAIAEAVAWAERPDSDIDPGN